MTSTPPPEPEPGSESEPRSQPQPQPQPKPQPQPPRTPEPPQPPPPASPPPTPYPPFGTDPHAANPHGANPYGTAPYGTDPANNYGQFGAPPVQRRNGLGLTAMILGIIALIAFWIPGVAVILAILAIVFGAIGLNRVSRSQATNRGQALAGLVLGIVALVATVAFWIWVYNTTKSCVDQYNVNSPAYDQCVRDKVRR